MSDHTGHGGGLRFTLFGMPVTVRLSIVLVLGFLGYGQGDLITTLLFVGIGLVSILLHELGHGIVARMAGTEPRIELAGMGGLTTYAADERTTTRRWSLAIGLAGPGVGLLVGLAALPLRSLVTAPSRAAEALSILIFTSIGWSILNLLPVPPMDGGQAMTALLPGDLPTRRRRGAAIGIGTAALLALAGSMTNNTLLTLFGLLFAFQNFQTFRALRAHATTVEHRPSEDPAAQLARQGAAARDWFAAGNGRLEDLATLQQRAAGQDMHQLTAELGEVALRRGATSPDFAIRTARAWHALGVENRAMSALDGAIALGADPVALAGDPTLPSR